MPGRNEPQFSEVNISNVLTISYMTLNIKPMVYVGHFDLHYHTNIVCCTWRGGYRVNDLSLL